MISKKFVLFEVSISNQPVFCADQESAIENCDKRIFWPPEGRKVEPSTPKIFKWPYLDQIWLKWFFLLQEPFLGSNSASCKMNWKCLKICSFDLNLPCFQVRWPSLKIFQQKNFSCGNQKCFYIINKHFLFPWPISQMFWWFSIKQNAKKTCFLPFLATRWGRNHSKTPDSDSQRQITPI